MLRTETPPPPQRPKCVTQWMSSERWGQEASPSGSCQHYHANLQSFCFLLCRRVGGGCRGDRPVTAPTRTGPGRPESIRLWMRLKRSSLMVFHSVSLLLLGSVTAELNVRFSQWSLVWRSLFNDPQLFLEHFRPQLKLKRSFLSRDCNHISVKHWTKLQFPLKELHKAHK